MLQQHRSHLVSTYTTVLQHIDEIRQAASGKSPGGGRLVPLPQSEQERLAESLDAIATRLEQIVCCLAGDLRGATGDSGDIATTRMWINILLRTIGELVGDLHPARMERRYGALEPSEAILLRDQIEGLMGLVKDMVLT